MSNDFQRYYDQSDMVLKTDYDTLYVLPNFQVVPPSSDGVKMVYFQQYQQAYNFLTTVNAHHKVTVIKDKLLRIRVTKQQSPAWLPGSRTAENGGIKRSKSSIRGQQNQSETIGLAKRPGKIDHSIENLAKQIVGRKIIVQTRAKPASITKPKATAITSKGYPTCFWENQTNCSYNPLKDPPLVKTSASHRSLTGELEAGLQKSNGDNILNITVGATGEAVFVPLKGGGNVGINWQDINGEQTLWGIVPRSGEDIDDLAAYGADASVIIDVNIAVAYGHGLLRADSWAGLFKTHSFGFKILSVSYFTDESGIWHGVSLGRGWGPKAAKFGYSYAEAIYTRIDQ